MRLALGEEADMYREDGRLPKSSKNLAGNDGKTILVPTYSRILLSKWEAHMSREEENLTRHHATGAVRNGNGLGK